MRAPLALALLAACGPRTLTLELPPDTRSALYVPALDSGGFGEIQAYTIDLTVAERVEAVSERAYALAYTSSFPELFLDAAVEGERLLTTEETDPVLSSRLPLPAQLIELGDGESHARTPDERAFYAQFGAVRAVRAPCPVLDAPARMSTFTATDALGSAMLARLGDELVVVGGGQRFDPEPTPPALFVMIDRAPHRLRLPPNVGGLALAELGDGRALYLYDDASETTACVLSPDAPTTPRCSALSVEEPTRFAGRAQAIAARADGDGYELALMTQSYELHYAASGGPLRRIVRDPVDPDPRIASCGEIGRSAVALAFTGPGRGVAGMRFGSLLRFDGPGRTTTRLFAKDDDSSYYCRSSYGRLDDAIELVFTQRPGGEPAGAWRLDEGPWRPLEGSWESTWFALDADGVLSTFNHTQVIDATLLGQGSVRVCPPMIRGMAFYLSARLRRGMVYAGLNGAALQVGWTD